MIRFNNDYNVSAHPAILEALAEDRLNSYPGYGLDSWCEKASAKIKESFYPAEQASCDVRFLVGGTQANFTVIAAALRPFQSVLCAESGHIAAHETGAVEHIGHKVETLKGIDGKISGQQVYDYVKLCRESPTAEHITQPGMVYISFPTEYGTVYTKKELEELRAACDEFDMYLFIDGARLGYGLAAEGGDVSMADIAKISDVFYIGGTKCGLLFGEAVVIRNDDLKPYFRNYTKQNGGMLAKGWLLGLQFYTIFKDNLYYSITDQAVKYAMQIKAAFAAAGVASYIDSNTNQQFVVLENSIVEKLSKECYFEPEGAFDATHSIVRFCTAWSNTQEDIDALIALIKKYIG